MGTTLRTGGEAESGHAPAPDDLSGVANCRHWLHRRLDALRLPASARADLELVASELIANAFLHAAAPRSVWLRLLPGRIRVTVQDSSRQAPTPRFATATETHGRGLRVVAALAQRWGTFSYVDGKAVWADVPIPRTTRRGRVFAAGRQGRSQGVPGEP